MLLIGTYSFIIDSILNKQYSKNAIIKFLSLSLLVLSTNVFAESFEYPELMVTPKASSRLAIESKREQSYNIRAHLPIQISSAMTLIASIMQSSDVDLSKDKNESSPKIGMAIGLGWLTGATLMSFAYRPYYAGLKDARGINAKDKRGMLTRERMAEETLSKTASFGRKLTWLSVISNSFANAYMLGKSKRDSNAVGAALVGLIASISPIVFPYRWGKIHEEQEKYKKRIYGPVASVGLLQVNDNEVRPGMILSMNF